MSQSKIIVGHEELSRFIRDTLEAKGARPEDAAVVADGLVWANLRGIDGHGVSRLPFYLRMIERADIDVATKPSLAQDRAATFVLDGARGFGPVAMMQAIALATKRAAKAGVCFGLLRDTTHTGAIGRYVQWMAERGCAAMIMGAGPAFVAYHGARVPSLGTSPIAIAVPSGDGAIVLDMATSAISNGTILQARATGALLPPNSALTMEGEPTGDPSRAEILLPLGGAKGSGLGFMFEMLASVLAAAPIQARARARAAQVALAEHRDPRRRCRGLPAGRRFRARCRCAGSYYQIAAASGGRRRNSAPRRARRAHGSRAPKIRHSYRGQVVGGTARDG